MNKRAYLVLAAASAISACLLAQQPAWPPASGHLTLPVWPGVAPGAPANPPAEADTTTAKDDLIAGRPIVRLGNVSTPTLTLYSPTGKNSGAAVVVFPGGGYRILAIDLEGTGGLRLAQLRRHHLRAAQVPRAPTPGLTPNPPRPCRTRSAPWAWCACTRPSGSIDPNRIGVLGFSAGGHLAAAISTHFDQRLYDPIDAADKLSCRPDFAVVIYPGYLALADQNFAPNPDIHPTANTPPTFIVQAEDDPVHVENAVVYFLALKNAKVPAELHIYAQGGHGYGLRRTALPVTAWPQEVETWLRTIKMLPATSISLTTIVLMLLAVLTVSDRCSQGLLTDTAGPAVVALLSSIGRRPKSGPISCPTTKTPLPPYSKN